MPRNAILILAFVAVVAMVLGSILLGGSTDPPPGEPSTPHQKPDRLGDHKRFTSRVKPQPTSTPVNVTDTPTPALPAHVREEMRFAFGWLYTAVVGDIVDIDFGGGFRCYVRLNESFLTPEGEEATLVEIRLDEAVVVVRRHADGTLYNVPKAPPKPTGLILYYAFDEDAGTEAVDKSGAETHGDIHGAAWTKEGRFGGGCEFHGPRDHIRTKSRIAFERFSFSVWVLNRNPFKYKEAILHAVKWRLVGEDGIGEDWLAEPGVEFALMTQDPRPGTGYVYDGTGEWKHFAGTYDGESLALYVNGQLVGRTKAPDQNLREEHLVIGAKQIGAKQEGGLISYFSGKIDEVMIFDRALSEPEIKRLSRNPGIRE